MPLSFDHDLATLRAYTGRTPRPAIFDAYWQEALDALAATPADADWRPVASPLPGIADCHELWFTGVGGARVHARVAFPAHAAGRCPAAVEFHGYARRTYDWAEGLTLALAAAGVVHAGLDCRGQGGLSDDVGGVSGGTLKGHVLRGLNDAIAGRPDRLLYRAHYLDALRLTQLVMAHPRVDAGRVATYGRSQGGALALVAAALAPQVARCAPTFPFLCDFRRAYEMDVANAGPYGEIAEWFRRFDPLHAQEAAVFDALGLIDVQNFACRVRADVTWSIGLMDTICPPSTQFAAYNRLTCPKSMLVYPDFGHEPFDHGDDRLLALLTGM
jgi:cephalosporin-C deacetylase